MTNCSLCTVRNRAVCAHLLPDEVEALSHLGHKQNLKRGQSLLWEGDRAVVVGNVIEGMLKLSTSMPDGREQIVGIGYPSDFIGRPYGEHNPYTVTALTDVRVCLFAQSDFERFAQEHPALESKLLNRTLEELDRARQWMLTLGRKSAVEKVATFLLEMSGRLSQSGCAETVPFDSFDLPIDRQQMADVMGLTIETVSRQLGALKLQGIIGLDGRRRVLLFNRRALEDIASGESETARRTA